MSEHVFTDANFDLEVMEAKGPVLVDFWAAWCYPCRRLGPVIEELSQELGDKIKVGKLNVDENPRSASRFGIQGIPTVLLFKDGQKVNEFVGLLPKQNYLTAIEALASAGEGGANG